MEKKKITITIAGILVAVLVANLVSAVFWACFDYGETRNYCSNYKPPETCDLKSGCRICMSEYREADNCYVGAFINICNNQADPTTCATSGSGDVDFDLTPPEFTITSIKEGDIFTSRSILLEFSLNEKADVYYLDLINGRGRWTRVCSDCTAGDPSYSRPRSFSEGENNLEFRATDVVGNDAYYNISFYIDSKDPSIMKTEPRRGFATGNFEVQFKEDNPEKLTLYYGTSADMREKELDIENDCELERTKYYCDTDVELDSYDGKEIEYYFTLKDIANNTDESKHYSLDVDTEYPVVNNPDSFYTNDSKYIYFVIDITEDNLEEVSLIYDYKGKQKESRLCTRLKNGVCEKKFRYREEYENMQVTIMDEAGNAIAYPVVL